MSSDRRRLVALLPLLVALAGAPARANVDQPIQDFSKQIQTTQKPAASKPELLVVPIPMSNPALGSGLTLAAALFYNPNHAPQPWISGVGVTRTSNKSWAAGAVHVMSLDHDKFRLAALGGYGDFKLKFYGIGPNAGERGIYVDMDDKGIFGLFQGLMRVAPHFYAGGRYEYLHLDATVTVPNPIFPDLDLPPLELKSKISGLGPSLAYDSRDSSTNPRKGAWVTFAWLFNTGTFGSDFDYNKGTFAANAYIPVGPTTNFAARISLCGVSHGAPFYDLCSYGEMGDLRGYEAGRYRDHAFWATQAEVRQHLFWKIGVVGFAGAGGVAPSLSKLDEGKFLPSAGLGLRFLAAKRSNVNLRLDYAWGKGSHAFYFGIGESF